MAILFIAAEADELEPLAARVTALRKLKWPLAYAYEGILEGKRVMLAAHGAGPRLASQALEIAIRAIPATDLSSSKLEGVVSVGYCGALQPGLREGAILVPAQVLDAKTQTLYDCHNLQLPVESAGVLLSQDRVATTAAEKLQLGQGGAVAVDMEAAGVAERAKRAHLPFCCIKVVSDRVDESFGLDLNQARSEDGRIARGKIVVYALGHPLLIPELFRLRRRTREAAQALGEFLVSCPIHFEGEPALAG